MRRLVHPLSLSSSAITSIIRSCKSSSLYSHTATSIAFLCLKYTHFNPHRKNKDAFLRECRQNRRPAYELRSCFARHRRSPGSEPRGQRLERHGRANGSGSIAFSITDAGTGRALAICPLTSWANRRFPTSFVSHRPESVLRTSVFES